MSRIGKGLLPRELPCLVLLDIKIIILVSIYSKYYEIGLLLVLPMCNSKNPWNLSNQSIIEMLLHKVDQGRDLVNVKLNWTVLMQACYCTITSGNFNWLFWPTSSSCRAADYIKARAKTRIIRKNKNLVSRAFMSTDSSQYNWTNRQSCHLMPF